MAFVRGGISGVGLADDDAPSYVAEAGARGARSGTGWRDARN
jgi:hypothetical protein